MKEEMEVLNLKNRSENIRKRLLNATPHPVTLVIGEEEFTIPPSGIVIAAEQRETLVRQQDGISFVKMEYVPSAEAEGIISQILEKNPDTIILGSIIAAQAFPGKVYAMIPLPGYERVPPHDKKMWGDKFSVF